MAVAKLASGSKYQQAIWTELQKGSGHIVVKAGAGTGKTFTLVGGMERLSRSLKIFYTAFNKKIVADVAEKIKHLSNVNASTAHSAGNGCLREDCGAVKAYEYATVGWVDRAITLFEDQNDGGTINSDFLKQDIRKFGIADLIKWVKETNPYFKSEEDFIEEAPAFIKGITKDLDKEAIYQLAGQLAYKASMLVLTAAKRGGRFSYDYTDMIWIPVRLGIVRGRYDVVIIDEAQDMNACMLELVRMLCRVGGRILAVGDTFQSIYAFRGADSEALERLTRELNATVFTLPVSYRVPKSGAEFARQFLPEDAPFEAFEGNREGLIREDVSQKDFVKECKAGDLVMCRVNRPLVRQAIKFLTEGRAAFVAGFKIGQRLQKTVKQIEAQRGKFRNPSEMKVALEEWFEDEKAIIEGTRWRDQRKTDEISKLEDNYQCLLAFANSDVTIEAVKLRMKKLFADPDHKSIDPKKFICLSSIHRAKGLESENTWVISDSWGGTSKSTNEREEKNLQYVASTRHKNTFSFVEAVGNGDSQDLDEDGE